MTYIDSSYLTHEMQPVDLSAKSPTSTAKTETFRINLNDCGDNIFLIFNALSCGTSAFNVAIQKGCGPAARSYTVTPKPGALSVMKICTAEVMDKNCGMNFTVTGPAALNTSGLKLSVLKMVFVDAN